jgi:peptide/nickel transport system permease protein
VVRRLLISIPVLLIVPFLVFVLLDLSPGNAAVVIAGPNATPAQVKVVTDDLHLNEPLLERYGRWADGALHGQLGESFQTRQHVTTMLGQAIPVTLSLGLLAIVLTILFGVAIGAVAAYKPNGVVDRAVIVLASVGVAVPGFWLGLMLVLVFSIHLRWLPAVGYVGLTSSPVEWLRHLILPAISLSLVSIATIGLQTRAALGDEFTKEYVLAARSRGLRRRVVLFKHTLKNAGVVVTTLLGYQLAYLIGGAVIIEQVFDLHGVGQLAIGAASAKDVPLLLGVVLMITISIIVVNLLVDMSYGYFNPRIRVGAQ